LITAPKAKYKPENETDMTTLSHDCRTHNKRVGAAAAGSANLKGSAEMPPLRQAAIPLYVSRRVRGGQSCGNRENLNVEYN
jgi:hypothetical protein